MNIEKTTGLPPGIIIPPSMTAQVSPRIRLENRPKLEEHIPLDTPFIINVDPSDKCSLACNFCPTGDLNLMRKTAGRNYGPMSFDLFKKIIDDLREFERPIKVLRLYKDGEPLMNPHFADMVRYAKQSGCCETIDTTINGTFLNPKRNIEIAEAGLNQINISIYGMSTEQYVQFSKRKIEVERLVENIRDLYQRRGNCKILVKINGDVIPKEDVQGFINTFGNICDKIFVEHIMSCWPEFNFQDHGVTVNPDMGIYGQSIKEVLCCPYVFYSFSINSNGTVSTCFLDWERKLIIGDVNTESVRNIWLGAKLKAHQIMMLQGDRKNHPTCRNCGQMTHGQPDNIDPHRSVILKKVV